MLNQPSHLIYSFTHTHTVQREISDSIHACWSLYACRTTDKNVKLCTYWIIQRSTSHPLHISRETIDVEVYISCEFEENKNAKRNSSLCQLYKFMFSCDEDDAYIYCSHLLIVSLYSCIPYQKKILKINWVSFWECRYCWRIRNELKCIWKRIIRFIAMIIYRKIYSKWELLFCKYWLE